MPPYRRGTPLTSGPGHCAIQKLRSASGTIAIDVTTTQPLKKSTSSRSPFASKSNSNKHHSDSSDFLTISLPASDTRLPPSLSTPKRVRHRDITSYHFHKWTQPSGPSSSRASEYYWSTVLDGVGVGVAAAKQKPSEIPTTRSKSPSTKVKKVPVLRQRRRAHTDLDLTMEISKCWEEDKASWSRNHPISCKLRLRSFDDFDC